MAAHSCLFMLFLSTFFLVMSCVSPPHPNESSLPITPKPHLLSLPLYHVEYFNRSSRDDYFHVFSRLMTCRDKARQEYLAYVHKKLGPNVIESNPESSCTIYMEKSGLYVVGLKVGSIGQILCLLLDTGSNIVCWQCQPCMRCFKSDHPIFDPKLSSSFRCVSCHDKECVDDNPNIEQSCDDYYVLDECHFHVQYHDHDWAEGAMARHEVTTMNDETFERDLIFVCERKAVGQHYSSYDSGTLGFNQDLHSFPTRIRILQFSLCYATPHSNKSTPLLLGQIPTFGDRKIVKAEMIPEGSGLHYYVKFSGIKIGLANTISMDPEQWWYRVDRAIVDRGTVITRFLDTIYREFRESFKRQSLIKYLDEDDTQDPFDTCYQLSNPRSVNLFPRISLVFTYGDGDHVLELEPHQTIVEVASVLNSNVYCLAFAGHGVPDSIIGTWKLQHTRVNFDVMAKPISLVPKERD